jgi:hypothetical protein
MAKRILIIDGHPDADRGRLCHALADTYAKSAGDAGSEVRLLTVGRGDLSASANGAGLRNASGCAGYRERAQRHFLGGSSGLGVSALAWRRAGAAARLSRTGRARGLCRRDRRTGHSAKAQRQVSPADRHHGHAGFDLSARISRSRCEEHHARRARLRRDRTYSFDVVWRRRDVHARGPRRTIQAGCGAGPRGGVRAGERTGRRLPC